MKLGYAVEFVIVVARSGVGVWFFTSGRKNLATQPAAWPRNAIDCRAILSNGNVR